MTVDKAPGGIERRDTSVFGVARRVAHDAAQEVAALHRRRLVTQAFLAGLIAALLIALPVTVVAHNDANANATREARANCQITALGRAQGNDRALIGQIVLGLADAAFAQFPAKFKQAELRYINSQVTQAAHHGLPLDIMPVRTLTDLARYTRLMPALDCQQAIR